MMSSMCFRLYVLTNIEVYVFNRFSMYSNGYGIDNLYRCTTTFLNRPCFYQYSVSPYSSNKNKVFIFSTKKDTNRFMLVVKCGKIRLKNGEVISPVNKVIEMRLPLFVSDYENYNRSEIEDSLLYFSTIDLPKFLFSNYKLNSNMTLHDCWIAVRDKMIKEKKEAAEKAEQEMLEEKRRKKEEIKEFMGEEVF